MTETKRKPGRPIGSKSADAPLVTLSLRVDAKTRDAALADRIGARDALNRWARRGANLSPSKKINRTTK